MGDVLICADSTRSPEMRHEVPVAIPDAFLYVEHDGRRVVGRQLARGGAHRRGGSRHRGDPARARSASTSCCERHAGRRDAPADVRPRLPGARDRERRRAADASRSSSPIACARTGSSSRVDRELFEERRRRKNATEIAGLRRAQRACEAALDVAREMLRNATVERHARARRRAAHVRADQGGGRARLRRARRVRRRVHRLARRADRDRPRERLTARSCPASRSSSISSRATARPASTRT